MTIKPADTLARELSLFLDDAGMPKPGSTTYRVLSHDARLGQLHVMSTYTGVKGSVAWQIVREAIKERRGTFR